MWKIITKQEKQEKLNVQRPWYSGLSIKGVNSFFQKHFVSFISAVGIGIPLSIMLFSMWAILPMGIVFSAVMGIYGLYKYYEKKQVDNLNKIIEAETKLPLIELAEKLKAKADQKSPSVRTHDNSTVQKNISQMDSAKGTTVETFKEKPTSNNIKFFSTCKSESYLSDRQSTIDYANTGRPSSTSTGSPNVAAQS